MQTLETIQKTRYTCLSFQQTQPQEKIIHNGIPGKLFEVKTNNKTSFCIVDSHSKFPIEKRAEDMSAESLIIICKVMFSEYGLPKKIMYDAGGNFI